MALGLSSKTPSSTCCGHSTIVDPEGKVVYKCDSEPMTYTEILDFEKVTNKRLYGRDQHLNCLRKFQIKYPFAGRLDEAPVYEGMPEVTYTPAEFIQRVHEIGFGSQNTKPGIEEKAVLDAEMSTLLAQIKK